MATKGWKPHPNPTVISIAKPFAGRVMRGDLDRADLSPAMTTKDPRPTEATSLRIPARVDRPAYFSGGLTGCGGATGSVTTGGTLTVGGGASPAR